MRIALAVTLTATVLALAGCGATLEQRAATGAIAGAVIAGPAGAAVGGAAGAAVGQAAKDDGGPDGGLISGVEFFSPPYRASPRAAPGHVRPYPARP